MDQEFNILHKQIHEIIELWATKKMYTILTHTDLFIQWKKGTFSGQNIKED